MGSEQLKVLVVDDDPFVREMLAEILKAGNYTVVTAENGVQALDLYHDISDLNLILSDMNMPEMDGMGIIRNLREKKAEIPIVILTSNTEMAMALKAIRAGANDYLLKDENIEDTLLFSVEKVLERYRLEQQNKRLLKELEEKNRELERLTYLDGLTGIANRRYFDKIIAQEWGRATRLVLPIGLIMIDIDFFKRYNDTFGHQRGDDCLKQVASALNTALKRFGDAVFRYGGEEFVAILPGSDIDGAVNVAEKMRRRVLELEIPHSDSPVSSNVTVSLGVGSTIPAAKSHHSELIDSVDEALYEAKKFGRNRIERVHHDL